MTLKLVVDAYTDEILGAQAVGLDGVDKFPAIFAELVHRGWSDADLEKLAGNNVLRVLQTAETVSARLRTERPPSEATIETLDPSH